MPTTYAVPDGRTAMAATTYTGVGGSSAPVYNASNGTSFQPDLVWIKSRSAAYDHSLQDVVRGFNLALFPNLTNAEASAGYVSVFSNGFNVSGAAVNNGGSTFVGWQWKANGTAVTNTAGSITSSVSANPTTGFSIVRWTGTGASGTTGHGLGVAPKFMILKDASNSYNWYVFTTATGSNLRFEGLNTTSAASSQPSQFTTTSTLITNIPGIVSLNTSGATMILYCWAEIAGYSKFGSYTGNGSSDGPFVYTGFRPRFLLVKSSTEVNNWWLYDSSRSPYNAMNELLRPDLSNAEATQGYPDFLSNGWKIRNTGQNTSGQTYIYMAFAENPFKYANAR